MTVLTNLFFARSLSDCPTAAIPVRLQATNGPLPVTAKHDLASYKQALFEIIKSDEHAEAKDMLRNLVRAAYSGAELALVTKSDMQYEAVASLVTWGVETTRRNATTKKGA